MGMESFFVMMLAVGIQQQKNEFGIRKYIGKSNVKTKDFISFVNTNLILKKNETYVVDELIEMKIENDENDNIKTISFECCFFHYDEGIELIYQIARKIRNNFPLRLFHPAIDFIANDEFDIFKSKINFFYEKKYQAFIKNFGSSANGHTVLPNNGFTNYLQKIGRVK